MAEIRPMRGVGLNFREAPHFIDHLGPCCVALGFPLLVTEPSLAEVARACYPGLEVIEIDRGSLTAEWLVERFDVILQSDPWPVRPEPTADFAGIEKIPDWPVIQQRRALCTAATNLAAERGTRLRFVNVPHGFSDKGYFLRKAAYEDIAFVYGQNMIDLFRSLGVLEELREHVFTGNYRYAYYLQHRAFFDDLAQKVFFQRFQRERVTVLYAPTWKDPHVEPTSFFDACERIIEDLPRDHSLIVKLHPMLERQAPDAVRAIGERHSGHPRVAFIPSHPIVFPLLAAADVYVGDMSSVGYDFLAFDRPMFFLNQNEWSAEDERLVLYKCGTQIQPSEYADIFRIIEKALPSDATDFAATRRSVYEYTFGSARSFDQIRADLAAIVERA